MELPTFSQMEDVKKNFKRLALKYHPDINSHDSLAEERFKKINHAYQILSDPDKKRRYDSILKYQLSKPRYTFTPGNTPYSNSRQSRTYKYRKQGKKFNKKYNILTIAFFGLGILLFQIITQVNESRLKRNYEERAIKNSEIVEKSINSFEKGEFRNALALLNQISYTNSSKEVMILRERFLLFSDSISDYLMANEKYDSALYHLEIVLEHSLRMNPSVYTRISTCYRNMGNVETAITVLNSLLRANPNNLIAHKELASIYNYELGDYNLSLKHYESATKLIVRNYVDFYGKAYIAIINPRNHPKSDFDVFLEKSKIYYNLNEIDSSLIASKWATFLQPESPEAHYVQALCWVRKGKNKKACEEFKKIEQMGVILPLVDSLKNINC